MYIEIRKTAIYLKNSVWDKETKKTKNVSIYLGSDTETAMEKLKNLVTQDSPVIQELLQAQEIYAYNRAISVLTNLKNDLKDTKAGVELSKTVEKLIKAQDKYEEKLQKNSAIKSQFISDIIAQDISDDKAENLEKLEAEGQTTIYDVLPQENSDNQSQKTSDDTKAQKSSDRQSQKEWFSR